MEHHLLSTLTNDRHQELRRIAAEVSAGRQAHDARAVARRPLPLRLLSRVLGPR
jgi:hypothetical protein